jgi:hypothetical protein
LARPCHPSAPGSYWPRAPGTSGQNRRGVDRAECLARAD